jgi:lipopolysaccharide transport system ATP-binding protein
MTMHFAIKVEHIAKSYTIRVGDQPTATLTDHLAKVGSGFLNPSRWFGSGALHNETIWPLKDISFDISPGEVVGLIGRNGAGKSTLLKILARITDPTSGRAVMNGRVASLLEVGTGFHPELTGRDNIYLSGSILGMRKAEIAKKFDEIVAFAGVDKFIDTPVKRYSSGMYVRLAFAVGAHLDPEILIVDEVLAVGDAQFQKKCLSKMQDVGQHGRTVLFVSHNMNAITRLCKRAILLNQGEVVADGLSSQVVSSYLLAGGITCRAIKEWDDLDTAPGDDIVRLRAVRVKAIDGRITDSIDVRQSFAIEMEFDVLSSGFVLLPHFVLSNEEGQVLFEAVDLDPDWRHRPRPVGRYVCTAWIAGNLLKEGTFFIGPACMTLSPHLVDPNLYEEDAIAFHVYDGLEGECARGDHPREMWGLIRPMLKWSTIYFSRGSLERST